MYLKASQPFEKVIEATEASLASLKIEFLRNESTELVEYEINSPAYFRVVVEPRKDAEVHNFILPSIKRATGTTIELRFGLDSTREELQQASKHATLFLRTLVASLGAPPWEGLRMREAGREKKRWKEALKE